MSKELTPLEALQDLREDAKHHLDHHIVYLNERLDIIEKSLKVYEKKLEQAQKDKDMLNIFKNALTIERDIPPELEIKESEKGCSYVFREAVKIHENRIEEMCKKSLREWVLKNAFPKELKALEIIKDKLYSWSKQYIYTDEQRVSNVLTIYDIDDKEKKLLKEVLL